MRSSNRLALPSRDAYLIYGETTIATKRNSGGRKSAKLLARPSQAPGVARSVEPWSGKGGKGGKVKSWKQAIAIGLSEARDKGAKVSKKKA